MAPRCPACGALRSLGPVVIDVLLRESRQGRRYLARDEAGRDFVVEEVVIDGAGAAALHERWAVETARMRVVTHPSLPTLLVHQLDASATPPRRCVLLEAVGWKDLLGELVGRRWREADVRSLARELLALLQLLHGEAPGSAPVVHGAILPSNLLRTDAGGVALVGLAQARSATPAGIAEDVRGVAATALQLLSRAPPRPRAPGEVAREAARLGLSRPFATWLSRALDPRPGQGFRSAEQALRALESPPPPEFSPLPWAVSLALLLPLAGAALGAVEGVRIRDGAVPASGEASSSGVDESSNGGEPAFDNSAEVLAEHCPPESAQVRSESWLESYCVKRGTNVRHGVWVKYRGPPPSAVVEAIAHYRDGKRHGLSRTFDESGRVVSEGSYSSGRRVGPWKEGLEEGKYGAGERHGVWKRIGPDGQLELVQNFDHGVVNGPFTEYSYLGVPLRTGTYRNGLRHGRFVVYANDGKTPELELNYEDDRLHGLEIRYHPGTSSKALEAHYARGKLEGDCPTWDVDGRRTSLRRFRGGVEIPATD